MLTGLLHYGITLYQQRKSEKLSLGGERRVLMMSQRLDYLQLPPPMKALIVVGDTRLITNQIINAISISCGVIDLVNLSAQSVLEKNPRRIKALRGGGTKYYFYK